MVFSSFPLYHLDPPNWNQHNQQNSTMLPINESPSHHLISPPPPPPAITNQPPSSGCGSAASRPNSMAERARLAKIPQPEPALKCPRCDSSNTKFCYFNNYSLSQPRHFCKACRRYWTRGGALRNVPVGGGCRRNKRSSNNKPKSSSASAASSSSSVASGSFVIPSLPPPTFLNSLADQYNHHQGGDYGGGGLPFPFLGGLDSGIYPNFDGEGGGGGLGLGFGKAVQSTASGLISQLAAVKMEDNFPRQYMGMGMAAVAGSGGGDGQYLGGGGGGWSGDLSGFHPSVSGNML